LLEFALTSDPRIRLRLTAGCFVGTNLRIRIISFTLERHQLAALAGKSNRSQKLLTALLSPQVKSNFDSVVLGNEVIHRRIRTSFGLGVFLALLPILNVRICRTKLLPLSLPIGNDQRLGNLPLIGGSPHGLPALSGQSREELPIEGRGPLC